MPQKESYGYSGKAAVKKNSKMKIAMAVVGGAVGGAALGVGAYYAYQRYKDWDGIKQISWCDRLGTFYDCDSCRRKFFDDCKEDDDCFKGGCSYKPSDDLNRDDIMSSGYVPAMYTPPYKVIVTKVEGPGLTQADLKCDNASLELYAADYTAPLMFKPLLYVALNGDVDALDDDPSATPAPSAPSPSGSTATATDPPLVQTTDGASPHSSSVLVLAACLMASIGLPCRPLAMASAAAFMAFTVFH